MLDFVCFYCYNEHSSNKLNTLKLQSFPEPSIGAIACLIGYVNQKNQITQILLGAIQMITFKIISSTTSTTELKTRTHEKTYTVHECSQSQRIGYIMESIRSFDKDGALFKATQSIKSYYFGFPNSAQADKFADFARYKFQELDQYGTNCESRLSKRLKSPFEVKIRNLSTLKDELATFFGQCIDKELNGSKVIEINTEAMNAKVRRL